MGKEIAVIADPKGLVKFTDENDMLFHLTESEAALLFKYMQAMDYDIYRELGEREGQLFMKKGIVRENVFSGAKILYSGEWEPATMDEVADEICEMNYELRSEIQEHLEEQGTDFTDRNIYESLAEDSRELENIFSRTKFCKMLDELAGQMAEEAAARYLCGTRKEENTRINAAVEKAALQQRFPSGGR